MGKFLRFSILTVLMFGLISPAQAGWSWNIGYHNPPGSTLGLNFMHLWTNWAFEIGIGHIQSANSNNSNSSSSSGVTVSGDMNLKYLFGSQTFRPFLEAGVGLGTYAGNSGVAAGTGGGFFGGGFFLKGNPFYFYLGYLVGASGGGGDFNLGVGFDF